MNTLEEQWKEKVLESVKGIETSRPNPNLYNHIGKRIKSLKKSGVVEVVSFSYLSAAAAILVILSFLNIMVIFDSWSRQTTSTDLVRVSTEDTFSFGNGFNLYE